MPNIIVKIFDQNDGLPVVSLSDLTLGADNYLYVASYGGLSRFDGTRFELISSEQYPQLVSNRFIRTKAPPDSSLWIFDEEYRLSRWKAGKVSTFDTLNGTDEQAWINLKFSPSGDMWAANRNRLRIYSEGVGFSDLPYNSDYPISSFVPDTGYHAWIVNKEGMFEYSAGKLTPLLSSYDLPFFGDEGSVKISKVGTDKLAIYTYVRVVLYDLKSETFLIHKFEKPVPSDVINLSEINDSTFILKNYHSSHTLVYSDTTLNIVTPKYSGLRPEPAGYSQPLWKGKELQTGFKKIMYNGYVIYNTGIDVEIKQVLQDREENVWVSTGGLGLIRLSVSPFQLLNTSNGLPGNNIYSIVEDDSQSVWIGGFSSNIARIKGSQIYRWNKDGLSGGTGGIVRSLYKTRDGTMLSGNWTGGVKYFKDNAWHDVKLDETGAFSIFTVESYLEDDNENFWIGTREELLLKPPGSQYFSVAMTGDSRSLPMVQVMGIDKRGCTWFGTNGNGLYAKKDALSPITPVNNLTATSIRDIFTERSDTLWLASQNNGLIRALINKNGDIEHTATLTKADGLPDIGVHRILSDQYGFFWLPSNRGLSRINEDELNAYLDGKVSQLWIQTFTEDDGLPIREANGGVQSSGMVASDGTIWIPTQRGVVWFDPSSFLNKNPFETTEIQLSKIETKSHTYHLFGESSLIVNKSERSVNVLVSLLHYSSPENLDVQYRIISLKTGWQNLSKDRYFNIANIPPGTHTIEMRLAGVPETLHAGNSFSLIVPSYFYEESWFFMLVGIIALGMVGLVFTYTLTAAKRREKSLNDKVNERTHLLSEKTHLLEEQKTQTEEALTTVQHQARELERLNEVKTDFFINITHELRTPLSLIKGPLGLLKKAADRKNIDREEQLELIERNSNNLNGLVDRLLHLLRMETEQIAAKNKKIDLCDFIRHHAAQFESALGLTDKTYNVSLPEKKAYILADPHFLESIVNNLITNAIKYTRKGDRIDVSVNCSTNGILFEISDTGIGIASEDLQYIFDPFFRSKNAKELEGSGIGLSIVKRYMDRVGGEVEIESELNFGTSIRLRFPKMDSNPDIRESDYQEYMSRDILPDETPVSIPVRPYASAKEQPNRKPEILVIDDNKDLRLFFRRLLEEKYHVICAENGNEALELMTTHKPDLILSDVMMPGMDGINFTKIIRAQKEYELIPVVMLSAKKTDESITQGLKAGAQVYLTKPVENQILLAQIDVLLNREARLKKLKRKNGNNVDSPEDKLILQVDEIILRHLSDPSLTVSAIAEALYISESTLYRKWKSAADNNLSEYIVRTRLHEAILLIEKKGCSFTEACGVCGFSDPAYFSKAFKKYYHTTPTKYFRDKNR